jgi:hypothetical protein
MRQLILIIILLCAVLGLAAEEIIISPVEYHMLNMKDYDLNLTLSGKMGVFYANLSFEVVQDADSIPDFYSLFLAKDAKIERFMINGQGIEYYTTTDLHPKHFVPEFPDSLLLQADSPLTCYSFDPELFEPENTQVFIEYSFPIPEWDTNEAGEEILALGDIPFFFPRNIYHPTKLSLHLLTTVFYELLDADRVDIHGNLKRSHKVILDNYGDDIVINIKKVLN